MRKILFVIENFAPNNSIGAIRPTKFAKYLCKNGHIVDVITREESEYGFDPILESDSKSINSIIKVKSGGQIIRFATNYKDNLVKKRKEKRNNIALKQNTQATVNEEKSIKKKFRLYINFLKDLGFVWQFKKLKLDFSQYDFLFTTYGTYCNHIIGHHIKKRNPEIKWIADFRDSVFVDELPALQKFSKKYVKKYCTQADAITAVSEGVINNLFFDNYSGILKVITNGYDIEDVATSNNAERNSKLVITYAGQMYERRDFSIFFKVIKELDLSGRVLFNFVGKGFDKLYSYADKYDVTDILHNYGFVSRDKAIEIMEQSDMLIMSSWNTITEKGVLTGKLLEYMMLDKPIIGLVSGNAKGSLVKEVIENCRIGFAYEEANHAEDYEKLKLYVNQQCDMHEKNENLNLEPNLKEMEKYSYPNLTKQLTSLFESL